MADFLIELLNLVILPFKETQNLVVFIPVACMSVSFLLLLLRKLLRGSY